MFKKYFISIFFILLSFLFQAQKGDATNFLPPELKTISDQFSIGTISVDTFMDLTDKDFDIIFEAHEWNTYRIADFCSLNAQLSGHKQARHTQLCREYWKKTTYVIGHDSENVDVETILNFQCPRVRISTVHNLPFIRASLFNMSHLTELHFNRLLHANLFFTTLFQDVPEATHIPFSKLEMLEITFTDSRHQPELNKEHFFQSCTLTQHWLPNLRHLKFSNLREVRFDKPIALFSDAAFCKQLTALYLDDLDDVSDELIQTLTALKLPFDILDDKGKKIVP